jgi:hypothetical protein
VAGTEWTDRPARRLAARRPHPSGRAASSGRAVGGLAEKRGRRTASVRRRLPGQRICHRGAGGARPVTGHRLDTGQFFHVVWPRAHALSENAERVRDWLLSVA